MYRSQQIRRALLIVLALNVLITIIKLIIGFATGALSVIADGFHSIVDSSSNIVGLFGLWVAARPPDEDHPYGHRRYETIATFAIGGLLLLVSWEIVRGIIGRISAHTVPTITPLDIAIMAGTFVVNLFVVTYETRQGRALNSDILLADAAHTRTDLFVTISVVISLVAARLGVNWADLLVAAIVTVLIVHAALGILRKTMYALTDALVIDPRAIEQTAGGVPGVHFADRARSRGTSDAAYVDVHIKVDPAMSTAQAHAIASEVERRLLADVAGVVDAVVHIEPSTAPVLSEWENITVRARAEADALGIGIHDLHAHQEAAGGYSVEMHVEIPAHLSLGEAHAIADTLEQRLRADVPRIAAVTTHLEPLPVSVPGEESSSETHFEKLIRRIALVADRVTGAGRTHNVQIHEIDGHLTATVHVTLPAAQPLTESHALAEEVDRRILREIPLIKRVVVHVEPPE